MKKFFKNDEDEKNREMDWEPWKQSNGLSMERERHCSHLLQQYIEADCSELYEQNAHTALTAPTRTIFHPTDRLTNWWINWSYWTCNLYAVETADGLLIFRLAKLWMKLKNSAKIQLMANIFSWNMAVLRRLVNNDWGKQVTMLVSNSGTKMRNCWLNNIHKSHVQKFTFTIVMSHIQQ